MKLNSTYLLPTFNIGNMRSYLLGFTNLDSLSEEMKRGFYHILALVGPLLDILFILLCLICLLDQIEKVC
jgi:hypothetical protein